jgi:hypothetical protein
MSPMYDMVLGCFQLTSAEAQRQSARGS